MNNYALNQIFIHNALFSFSIAKKNGILRLPHSASPSQDDMWRVAIPSMSPETPLGVAGQDHVILRRHSRERQSKDLVDMVVGSTRRVKAKYAITLEKNFIFTL